MAHSKEPHRYAPETKGVATRALFPRVKPKRVGRNCCRRTPYRKWPCGLRVVCKGSIARNHRGQKGNSESAKCFGAGKAVRCRCFRCRRRMERITRPVPLREQRNDYLASRYKNEKTRFAAA